MAHTYTHTYKHACTHTHTHTHTHTEVYYSTTNKNELKQIRPFAGKWMDVENPVLSKISQTEEDKYCIFSFKCEI
jgi:hypothetical protein